MPNETILIVEDEAIIAFNLQRILKGFGYRVPRTVESGEAAIQAQQDDPPDLVLMDMKLQGDWDGIETAHRLHALSDVPVIYLTAYAEDSRLVKAGETAPYGYLVKPVQDRELHATIEMALYKAAFDRKLKASEFAYRSLYHNTPAMLHTTDNEGHIIQVSDYWLSAFGYTREEVLGRHILEFIASGCWKDMRETFAADILPQGAVQAMECQFVGKNGMVLEGYITTTGVYNEKNQRIHSLSALVDISARKYSEAAERDQRTLAEALRDTASALTATLSMEEVLDRVLDNVGKVMPYDAVDVMLSTPGEIENVHVVRSHGYREAGVKEPSPDQTISIQSQPPLRLMSETRAPVTFTDAAQIPDWAAEWACSYAGAPIIFKNHLIGFINLFGFETNFFDQEHIGRLQIFADQVAIAMENARLYAELERLATLDDLTGINNRRRLFELGQREFERSRRYRLPLAAILIDLDHFKKINDTHGHTSGDRVLRGLTKAITQSIREVDIFGRYGGEEFVVLLPQSNRQSAVEVAERLRALVAGLHFESERGEINVTISIGVALLNPSAQSLAALIDWADQAMYAAKKNGRNRVEIYRG